VLHKSDVAAFEHQTAKIVDESGEKVTYEGIPVVNLLRLAGAPTDKQLRGPLVKLYVVVEAAADTGLCSLSRSSTPISQIESFF
jgi:hypothetical protein